MSKQVNHQLQTRDQSLFSKLTIDEWKSYAGKVLAINPMTDEILAVGDSESELEQREFNCELVEYFHVPAEKSLAPSDPS